MDVVAASCSGSVAGVHVELVVEELGPDARIEELATALLPVATHLSVRMPNSAAHAEAIGAARNAVRRLAVFPRVEQLVGAERAEAVTLLLIAIADRLSPARRDELRIEPAHDDALAAELASLRAQLGALSTIASESGLARDS